MQTSPWYYMTYFLYRHCHHLPFPPPPHHLHHGLWHMGKRQTCFKLLQCQHLHILFKDNSDILIHILLLLMILNILFLIIFNILLLISRTMVCGTLVRQKGMAPSSFKAATKWLSSDAGLSMYWGDVMMMTMAMIILVITVIIMMAMIMTVMMMTITFFGCWLINVMGNNDEWWCEWMPTLHRMFNIKNGEHSRPGPARWWRRSPSQESTPSLTPD